MCFKLEKIIFVIQKKMILYVVIKIFVGQKYFRFFVFFGQLSVENGYRVDEN